MSALYMPVIALLVAIVAREIAVFALCVAIQAYRDYDNARHWITSRTPRQIADHISATQAKEIADNVAWMRARFPRKATP